MPVASTTTNTPALTPLSDEVIDAFFAVGAELAARPEKITTLDDPMLTRRDARMAAWHFTATYSGTFGFMKNIRAEYDAGTFTQTAGSLKAILNCLRADAMRKATTSTINTPVDFDTATVADTTPAVQVETPTGTFTVTLDDGSYVTLKIQEAPEFIAKTTKPEGTKIAGFLSGPNNESDYQSFAFVNVDGTAQVYKKFQTGFERQRTALAFLLAQDTEGLHAAGKMYAQQSGRCYKCNRTLTTPESIAAGIGPVCMGYM